MNKKKYNVKDEREIASIINHCLEKGYCDTSILVRKIAQMVYKSNNRTCKEFVEKLKEKLHNDYVLPSGETDERLVFECVDEVLGEYEK